MGGAGPRGGEKRIPPGPGSYRVLCKTGPKEQLRTLVAFRMEPRTPHPALPLAPTPITSHLPWPMAHGIPYPPPMASHGPWATARSQQPQRGGPRPRPHRHRHCSSWSALSGRPWALGIRLGIGKPPKARERETQSPERERESHWVVTEREVPLRGGVKREARSAKWLCLI
jgi:hypothetical protein